MSDKQTIQLPKIRTRGPLAERVYQIIKDAIISGRLQVGMWLQEEALTKALDVSRTPVREALNRLKSEGLVVISPRKGAHIIELTDTELSQLFEVREKVETTFFVRSAREIPMSTIDEFYQRFEQSEKSMRDNVNNQQLWDKSRQEYLKNDRALHDTLIRAVGNSYWEKIYFDIRDRIEIFGNQISFDQDWFDLAISDHYRILDAMRNGDFQGGKSAMQRHIKNIRKGIARIRKLQKA